MIKHYVLFSLFLISINSNPTQEQFKNCMSTQLNIPTKTLEKFTYAPNSSLHSIFPELSIPNPRWESLNFTSQKPILVITPTRESEIQKTILCCKKLGVQVRTKSGGHDYEGLSYISSFPFVIIDLATFRSIEINLEDETAWVQSGATIGELYYTIAKTSSLHGFPAGTCPSVGVGGHFSGGGLGAMMRKHGLAADNILDATLIDANGRILNRNTMGEGLFWAIRGGGAASFGVVLAWKIKLVRVPQKVTCFTSHRTLEQGASKLINRWQNVADKLDQDLFIRVIIYNLNGSKKTVQASFQALFLGEIERLIEIANRGFPELALRAQDCFEMNWIESLLFFAGLQGKPPEVLLDRTQHFNDLYFKAKSDFVQNAIPETAFDGVFTRFLEEENPVMIMEPLGGMMSVYSERETPFPHRRGNLFNIQYMVKWKVNGVEEYNRHLRWIRTLYDYMTPFVSKSPRSAYVNYRDLDLGINEGGNASYADARLWGMKYFKGNFKRLAVVKRKVDPENFFRNEQSIPPLITS